MLNPNSSDPTICKSACTVHTHTSPAISSASAFPQQEEYPVGHILRKNPGKQFDTPSPPMYIQTSSIRSLLS